MKKMNRILLALEIGAFVLMALAMGFAFHWYDWRGLGFCISCVCAALSWRSAMDEREKLRKDEEEKINRGGRIVTVCPNCGDKMVFNCGTPNGLRDENGELRQMYCPMCKTALAMKSVDDCEV